MITKIFDTGYRKRILRISKHQSDKNNYKTISSLFIMSKRISIHKAEFHKKFYVNSELLSDISSFEKFVYPLIDKNYFYLYDVENDEIISKSSKVEDFKIDVKAETVLFAGISPEEVAKLDIPKKTRELIFEGGDLMKVEMSKSPEGDALWKKVINFLNLYKFNESNGERILLNEELRNIYNNEIPMHLCDIGLSKLFRKIQTSKIYNLTIGWIYLTDNDFLLLSKLKKLQELSILYSFNGRIKRLPENLENLTVFGTTIQKMSEIDLGLPKLTKLNLTGNELNNLDTLLDLSENLEELIINRNLIKNFNIDELPNGLEYLELSDNLIENDLFNQNSVHVNLKYLDLSYNHLVISTSVLHRILKAFPSLQYLALHDNETDGISYEYLGDINNKNCLAKVQDLLGGIEFKHKDGEIKITDEKKLNHFVEVNWSERSLPLNLILSDIQYVFSMHMINMPSFSLKINGLYCFIEHDNCELFIKIDEELNQLVFRVQSDKSEKVALYFHTYLHELNTIISFNSHINVLPSIKNSKSCKFLEEFYLKAFKVDYKVKSKTVLKPSNNRIDLLINNRLIEGARGEGKYAKTEYENINNIAFVLFSGRSAYPFVLKNNILTNSLNRNQNFYYYLTLSKGFDKENYIKGITNKYLNASGLIQTDLFVDNDLKKKVSCFINKNYFYAKNGNLSVINPDLKLDKNYLIDVKLDIGKWCKFEIENSFIQLKYF